MSAHRIRQATIADIGDVDRLLQRSYPRLLKADYPPSVLVTALPRMVRAQPALLQSGRYYVVETSQGDMLGAGGWSAALPGRGREAIAGRGNVRHVVTDPDALRQGVARALLRHIFAQAEAAGMTWMHCLATRTAVPFYTAMGFEVQGDVTVPLGPGIAFPAVEMTRTL